MDKNVLPNRPGQGFGGTTGLRLAPPGLLQVDRWKNLTEEPAVASPDLVQPSAREDN